MTGGRPLRFLAIVLCGWSGARGVDLYRRGGAVADVWRAPIRQIADALGVPQAAAALLPWPTRTVRANVPPRRASPELATRRTASPPAPDVPVVQRQAAQPETSAAAPLLSPSVLPPPIARAGSRWAGSAWVIARNGSPVGVPGGQLGASQAGMRVTYALGESRRVALAARVSAPLSGRGREAAIGLDWQPTKAPVHVVVEHRFALDGGRSGPMIGIVGGFGPAEVAPGIRLEGYGQAGVIARDKGEAFADGAVRAAHPLGSLGPFALDIGAGLWGGAQRGASRLDVGPSLGIVVPLGPRSVRLTADWRERVAGTARPGSGPALSIGTNF